MRKTWLHYAKWSKRPKFKPAWSIKTPRKRSPVECNFDHVSHSGLFLGKSLCYWDILWTTLEHYIDGTMVHELDTANNYFCIYEKIKFACFFWPTLYMVFFLWLHHFDLVLLKKFNFSFYQLLRDFRTFSVPSGKSCLVKCVRACQLGIIGNA